MQHLDEGTIHAWLDGQLPRDEAQQVEAHVAECRPCADAVAEARGLIAASSRILMALDGVPREVVRKSTAPRSEAESPAVAALAPALVPVQSRAQQRALRRWFNGGSLAAAAAIVVAIGTVTVMRANKRVPPAASERFATPSLASGPSPDSSIPVAAVPAAPSAAPAALGERRAIGSEPQAAPPTTVAGTRGLSNELGRAAQSENARERSEESKKLADQRQSADVASSSAPALAQAKAQQQVAALNKPSDELTKDKKQEAQQAPARVDGFSAARDSRAKSDSARLDRAQVREADAAAAKVAGAGAVRGRVTDANNTGLSGAMVTVPGTTTGMPTNDAGEFTLGGLPPGSYRMTVRRIGYAEATRDVTVTAGQTVTADVVLSPVPVTLSAVTPTVVGGAAPAPSARARAAAPAPVPASPQATPTAALQANTVGCYELGITPGSSPSRTGFREMPRRVALDGEVAPSTAEGVWYRARDLSKTGAPNGVWRPAGPESIELTWTYGSRTAQIYLSGPPGSMLRGTIQEIDRATSTGEAGTVVTIRRPCA